jgi:hypothetical protein
MNVYVRLEGMGMTAAGQTALTKHELDGIAWKFLGSEFAGRIYADGPVDGRLDAYLQHHGLGHAVNDGSLYNALLERVMAKVGLALRNGILASTWGPHRGGSVQR